MDPHQDYRPDPPAGITYGDFAAARDRFFATLRLQSQIAGLERALALTPSDTLAEPARQSGIRRRQQRRHEGDAA